VVPPPNLTASSIDKAGDLLKRRTRDPRSVSDEDYAEARKVVDALRSASQRPMALCSRRLRDIVVQKGLEKARVTQRLERMPSVIEKVSRRGGTRLSKMRDIGGCRVVLPNLSLVYEVADRFEGSRAFKVTQRLDRIARPTSDGYRALHLEVLHVSSPRPVEIQLRTELQQRFAAQVELWDVRFRCDLKHGNGPRPLLDALLAVSDLYSVQDSGHDFTAALERATGAYQALGDFFPLKRPGT
jgi:putative GTP pyrophosphokinase